MPNTQRIQLSRNSVPRRLQQPEQVTTLRSVRQDNPTTPRDRTASPQPASPKNKIRPTLFDTSIQTTHPGRPRREHTRPTTTHLKPRVRSGIERIAEEQGL